MRRSIDNSSNAGKVVFFCFLVLVIVGLFVYIHFVLPPHEHASDEWIIETPVSCTADGYRYKKCDECGLSFGGETVAALGHTASTPVKENEKAPTCTDKGSYDNVTYCTVCDAELDRNAVSVNANGHTPTDSAAKENVNEATCTALGSYDEVFYCKVCEKEVSREQKEIPMIDHTLGEAVKENEVGSTCDVPGSYDLVTYCSVCNAKVSTENKTVPENGHSFDWTFAFTDGAINLTGVCAETDCGHVYDSEIDKDYTYDIQKDVAASTDATCVCGCDKYVATIYYKGEVVAEKTLDVETEPIRDHTLYGVEISTYALYDENGNVYYNISTPGLVLVYDETKGETPDSVWDENGYAIGVFKCDGCDKWITVRVYNDLA